jgi:hypothetical protein
MRMTVLTTLSTSLLLAFFAGALLLAGDDASEVPPSSGRPAKVDVPRLAKLISEGKLSGREASYWIPAPSAGAR